MTRKLFLCHTEEGKISLVKLSVDLDNVVDTSLNVIGDDDIGVVRGAEMIARRNHKLDRFLICKLKRKGEQGSDLLAGVMAILDNLAHG